MQTTGTYGSTDTQGSSRILIIDDRPVIRDMLRGKLSEVTSDISEAESGTQGLDLALNAPFDLILTDVEMPGIDGYALCELLKNSPRTRSIPVVIVSMHESEAAIDRGLRAGAAAYIGKSEMDHTLVPTVRQVLSKTSFRQKNVVLVVDDSFSIRRVVRQGLEEVGFVVAEAGGVGPADDDRQPIEAGIERGIEFGGERHRTASVCDRVRPLPRSTGSR